MCSPALQYLLNCHVAVGSTSGCMHTVFVQELLQWSTSTTDVTYIMWYLYFSSKSAQKQELLWMEVSTSRCSYHASVMD